MKIFAHNTQPPLHTEKTVGAWMHHQTAVDQTVSCDSIIDRPVYYFIRRGISAFSVYANMLLLPSCIARLVSVWCWSAWISGRTKIRSRSALTLRWPSAASSSGVRGDCCRGANMTTHSLSRETQTQFWDDAPQCQSCCLNSFPLLYLEVWILRVPLSG